MLLRLHEWRKAPGGRPEIGGRSRRAALEVGRWWMGGKRRRRREALGPERRRGTAESRRGASAGLRRCVQIEEARVISKGVLGPDLLIGLKLALGF